MRLPTYAFEDAELLGAVERLLAATPTCTRACAAIADAHPGGSPGPVRAADLIERLAATGRPATS